MSQTGFRFLVVTLLLVAVGVVMIYSASAIFAYQDHQDSLYFLKRQLLFVAIGMAAMVTLSLVDPLWFKKNSLLLVVAGAAALLIVFVPFLGHSGGGASRWIRLGPFHLQPAEFIKIVLTVYLADYLSRRYKEIQKGGWRIFLPPLFIFGILSSLVIVQPDLGSVIIFFLLTAALFFVAGIQLRYIMSLVLVALPAIVFLVILFPYRLARITAFLDPWQDPRGGGFQIIQSFISFGMGGWHGVGLGGSTQKLFYLPQSFTDFIFAIIGEELGLMGTLLVLALFVIFFIVGFKITAKSKDLFLNFLGRGLTLMITLQAFINIMVATGVVPTKGLPLPFISYGGSSLIMNMMAVGIILSIDRKLNRDVRKKR